MVDQLKREGSLVQDRDLARIWLTVYRHVNVYGPYPFNLEETQRRIGLRPLRQAPGPIP